MIRDLLHRTTHLVPGVPEHADLPPGHQGRTRHGRSWNHSAHHSAARPPRVLVGWQRRIAAFFGQEPS
ncbi:hypothetical protein [Nonomuraea sediminis]|uniref:hypothetical protein n=1 Tax=Nonomuraea sediminis TaxID=2835864 RepID=UPI001BDBDC25|nr:hypothetical protein [Nonomuraea sediminis]